MCYRKRGFRSSGPRIFTPKSNLQSTTGPYVYYNYDTPFWNSSYNTVVTENEPMDFNVVLYTEDNFKGWAVPMRKGKSVLFAEQYSPHLKTWHFKSMKINTSTKSNIRGKCFRQIRIKCNLRILSITRYSLNYKTCFF